MQGCSKAILLIVLKVPSWIAFIFLSYFIEKSKWWPLRYCLIWFVLEIHYADEALIYGCLNCSAVSLMCFSLSFFSPMEMLETFKLDIIFCFPSAREFEVTISLMHF